MIEYRFRVPSTVVFTLYSYSKALEYRFRIPTVGLSVPAMCLSCREACRDLKEWNIPKDLAMDRSAWRLAINVPES
jgi:hypothetical protein